MKSGDGDVLKMATRQVILPRPPGVVPGPDGGLPAGLLPWLMAGVGCTVANPLAPVPEKVWSACGKANLNMANSLRR